MRYTNPKPYFDIDPYAATEVFANQAMCHKDWQAFQRILDHLIIEPRPNYRAADTLALVEEQFDQFPTSVLIPVDEAFTRWTTNFYETYNPMKSFWCYVHNNREGIFYEIPTRNELYDCYRGQRFGVKGHQYQSGFGHP